MGDRYSDRRYIHLTIIYTSEITFFCQFQFSGVEHQILGGQVDQGEVRHDKEADGAEERRCSRSNEGTVGNWSAEHDGNLHFVLQARSEFWAPDCRRQLKTELVWYNTGPNSEHSNTKQILNLDVLEIQNSNVWISNGPEH